jgi:hypothetical protein
MGGKRIESSRAMVRPPTEAAEENEAQGRE